MQNLKSLNESHLRSLDLVTKVETHRVYFLQNGVPDFSPNNKLNTFLRKIHIK